MLINESPDFIGNDLLPEDPSYGDHDSITFALFNNFYLWSTKPSVTHGHLFEYLAIYIRRNFKNPFSKDSLQINHFGELDESDIDKFKNIINVDRTPVLINMPNVIQGRLWTDRKMISFWNDLVYIASRKKDIIEFIKLIKGDPKFYQYEIKNKLYNYDQFILGKYSDNLKFDQNAVHTLSPEKKGKALRDMGVVPKKPLPLLFRQMIQGESFRNWLENNI